MCGHAYWKWTDRNCRQLSINTSYPSYYAQCGLHAASTVNETIYPLNATENVNSTPTQTHRYCFLWLLPLELTWYVALKIACDSSWGYHTAPVVSEVSSTLLFLMALATSCISTTASLSSKISKACEPSRSQFLARSLSLCMCMCIFAVFLHKTYEFVSFVRDKMKQTELGEVIGTLRQERGEKEEAWGSNEYATCLTNVHRFRAPLGGTQ